MPNLLYASHPDGGPGATGQDLAISVGTSGFSMLLLLLSACDTLPTKVAAPTEVTACDELVAPPVSACFGGEGVEWEGLGTLELAVEGTVVSVATGPRPEACVVSVGNEQTGEGLVIEVEDAAGTRYVVSYAIPALDASVAVRDVVTLDLAYTDEEFAPDVGRARLLDASGTPLVVVTEAGSLEELALPDGVTLSEGEVRCTEDDGCGVYSKYDAEVVVSGNGGTLAYGEEISLGGFRVVSGGYERMAENQDVCPDWFVAHATVALVAE